MPHKLIILTLPDSRLCEPSVPVARDRIASEEFQTLCDDMVHTMHTSDGIGLAAPQVGVFERIMIVGADAFSEEKNLPLPVCEDLVLINPEFDTYSWKTVVLEEGCLSVPGIAGDVERHWSVRVRAFTRTGDAITFTATGYFARVLQHEHDHLNGILFVDRAIKTEPMKRSHGM